jgi:hypothetical protein
MSKYLWKFYWDCGRQGSVEGMFVATEKEINEAIGKYIYFGEILGKHSEISGTLEENDFEKVDLDSDTVEKVEKVLGAEWSGYNPLGYIRINCDRCGEVIYEHGLWYEHKVVDGDKLCSECASQE